MDPVRHFEADTVAAYAEGRMDPDERARFEDHLAICAPCREEMIAVRRILDTRRTSLLRSPLLLAAAASVVLLVAVPLIRHGGENQPGPGAVLHRSFPTAGAPVETVAPLNDAEVQGGTPLRFVWRNEEEGSTFRLTLLDEEGNLVWSTNTGDTTVAVPEEIRLDRGGVYFWYVDALSPDGRSATSGPRSFRLQ